MEEKFMSETTETIETQEIEQNSTEKTKRSREDILEIVIAVFLGITALATAWASWIGREYVYELLPRATILPLTETPVRMRHHSRLCRICRCGI